VLGLIWTPPARPDSAPRRATSAGRRHADDVPLRVANTPNVTPGTSVAAWTIRPPSSSARVSVPATSSTPTKTARLLATLQGTIAVGSPGLIAGFEKDDAAGRAISTKRSGRCRKRGVDAAVRRVGSLGMST